MNLKVTGRRTYVMSDIHNDADRFKQMMDLIGFEKEDILIIDGDIFDRGDKPIELYFDILQYQYAYHNIHIVRGNHDEWLRREILNRITGKDMGEYLSYNSYELLVQRLTETDLLNLAEWIDEMPYYINLELDGRAYQISHAQTYPTPERIMDKRKLYMGDAYHEAFLTGAYELKSAISIVGHTPTDDGKIWRSPTGKTIRIDSGCGKGFGGRLAALRLNDMQEFYV